MLVRDVLKLFIYEEVEIRDKEGFVRGRGKYADDYELYGVISFNYDVQTQVLQIITKNPPVDVIYIISGNYRNTFETSLKDYEADYDLIDHWDDRLEYRVTASPDIQKQIIDMLEEVQ